MSTNPAPNAPAALWKTCLDIENQDAGHYLENVNRPLIELIDGAPRRVLELGCAAGHFGAVLKERFPGVSVVGVDANRAAADAAAKRLDRVICARLEELDFTAHGLAEHAFDAVIAADILEHLVNPWRLLERLRTLLAPGGQLLASIPNVRNLTLVSDVLQAGRWAYQPQGLLDITHLRFFTLAEMRRMFAETGYQPEKFGAVISRGLNETYGQHRNAQSATIQLGRLTLSGVTPSELLELCAEQFLFRCRPVETSAPRP